MKNAFTLIEVLVVLIIISLVTVITTTILFSTGSNLKNKLYEDQVEMVLDAAKKWTVEYGYKVDLDNGYDLSLSELHSDGFLKSEVIVDPSNKKNQLCGTVKINYNNNKYSYSYDPVSAITCD